MLFFNNLMDLTFVLASIVNIIASVLQIYTKKIEITEYNDGNKNM